MDVLLPRSKPAASSAKHTCYRRVLLRCSGSRSLHGDVNHSDIATLLHEIGVLSQKSGDLQQAKQLKMLCSLQGNRDHPWVAATLHELGQVSQQAGDLKQARE